MNKNIFYFLILFLIFQPAVYAVDLTNFDITVDVRSPQKAFVKEVWDVSYGSSNLEAREEFKQKILEANIDLDRFSEIHPNLRPNIYLRDFSKVTINFDESKDQITINYEITGVILQNFYETEDEILWKFNENILRNLITNNLYVVPSNSRLNIEIYNPLVITDISPDADYTRSLVSWTSISSNEIKLLAYEKKPPKPSFVLVRSEESDIFYYLILVFIILISIILIFKDTLEKSITRFVVKHSEIKPKGQRKEIVFEQDIFDD